MKHEPNIYSCNAQGAPARDAEVLQALRNVIDPDFGEDIVSCGFIKDLVVDAAGRVAFTLELTTPACPVKEMFQRQCNDFIRVSRIHCTGKGRLSIHGICELPESLLK